MGFGSNDDNDNDLPDWLKGMEPEDDNGGLEPDDDRPSDSEDLPPWLQDAGEEDFSAPESEEEEEVPDWLAKIRQEAASQAGEGAEEEDWLSSPADEEPEEKDSPEDALPPEEAGEEDEISAAWGEEPVEGEEDEIVAQWEAETGALTTEEDEDEVIEPEWVKNLPAIEVSKEPAEKPEQPQTEGEEVPDWLEEIRQKTTEETRPPDDVLADFGLTPEDMYAESGEEQEGAEEEPPEEEAEELPEGLVPEETPPTTGSLPTWLENLQTSGLVPPAEEEGEEERPEQPVYSEDEVSSLFEEDDLPDWLGEEVEDLEEEEEEAPLEQPFSTDEELEKADLPSWLQAMRPVEAVTADTGEEEDQDEQRDAETIGPLSGLRDVLPAEPHIVHFGAKPRPYEPFDLTESQKKYAGLLESLVEKEAAFTPAERRSVANPQQILRWVIATVLLAILFAVAWLNGDFMPLPAEGFPDENLAVVSLVNELQAGERVLVAFEYQPGLSGEMEAASAALMEHLLLREAQLVMVSTQPVGPGMAESFLQQRFQDSAYVSGGSYANLGYISGGTAGLLSFASSPRQAKPEMLWNTAPLDVIQSVRNFAMVVVITDDPDVARSWVEQVGPLLDPGADGNGVPMVMVSSAQAEPLIYPYYLSEPKQVAGIISGVGGGAYYETVISPSVARRYWDAYNAGLVVAVLVVAVGSIINLTRTSLEEQSKGRPR